MIQAEEERLTTAQLASDEKQKMGRLAAGEAAAPLPTQNGEGDSLSINSGILQVATSHKTFCIWSSFLPCPPPYLSQSAHGFSKSACHRLALG